MTTVQKILYSSLGEQGDTSRTLCHWAREGMGADRDGDMVGRPLRERLVGKFQVPETLCIVEARIHHASAEETTIQIENRWNYIHNGIKLILKVKVHNVTALNNHGSRSSTVTQNRFRRSITTHKRNGSRHLRFYRFPTGRQKHSARAGMPYTTWNAAWIVSPLRALVSRAYGWWTGRESTCWVPRVCA